MTVRLAPNLGATPVFRERLKYAVLESAAAWGEAGAPKRVVLTVTGYQIYRPGRVLVHDAGSIATGRALVLDQATGRSEAVVEVSGAVRHTIGATGRSWGVDRSVEEAGIAASLAQNLMAKLRGPAAIKARERKPSTRRAGSFDRIDSPIPRQVKTDTQAHWDHRGEMTCLAILDEVLANARAAAPMPPYCRVLGYRLPQN